MRDFLSEYSWSFIFFISGGMVSELCMIIGKDIINDESLLSNTFFKHFYRPSWWMKRFLKVNNISFFAYIVLYIGLISLLCGLINAILYTIVDIDYHLCIKLWLLQVTIPVAIVLSIHFICYIMKEIEIRNNSK